MRVNKITYTPNQAASVDTAVMDRVMHVLPIFRKFSSWCIEHSIVHNGAYEYLTVLIHIPQEFSVDFYAVVLLRGATVLHCEIVDDMSRAYTLFNSKQRVMYALCRDEVLIL